MVVVKIYYNHRVTTLIVTTPDTDVMVVVVVVVVEGNERVAPIQGHFSIMGLGTSPSASSIWRRRG